MGAPWRPDTQAETSARRRPQLTTVLTTVRSSFLTTVHRSTLTNRWRATKTRCASLPTPRMGEGAHGSHRSLDAGVEPPSPPSALLTIPVLGIDVTPILEGPFPVALMDLRGLERLTSPCQGSVLRANESRIHWHFCPPFALTKSDTRGRPMCYLPACIGMHIRFCKTRGAAAGAF